MPIQTTAPLPAPGQSPHRLRPGTRFDIAAHPTDAARRYRAPHDAAAALEGLRERIATLHDRFAAEAGRALLVILQGFDGAGKDGVISEVMTAIDPAGLHVFSFNVPVGAEADHDFLWRFHQQAPARGMVHVFDRSYYEEVIAARVHGIVGEAACRARYDSINDLERLLARDGTITLKFFLHISEDVQAERVRERLRVRSQQSRFSASDVTERARWGAYERAYEDALNATSTPVAPWHAIPADTSWYAQVAVAQALASTLEALAPPPPARPRRGRRGGDRSGRRRVTSHGSATPLPAASGRT
jgi:PPK2 family polyphosphate:nucleotide phosphotransferase